MIIREIEDRDNKEIETIIRECLIEFGGNRDGLAWADPLLGSLSKVYGEKDTKYWVVEKNEKLIGGCGIGKVEGADKVCELQKMYFLEESRGSGIATKLMKLALEFARDHYDRIYIETLSNMDAANKFYLKHGFTQMDKPLLETEHYACDVWYIKDLK